MFVKTSEWRPLWETAEWRPGQLPLNIEAKCSYSAYGFLEPRKPRLHDFKMRRLNKSKSAKYSGVTAGGYDVTMTSLYFTHPKWRPVVTSRCTGLHTPHLGRVRCLLGRIIFYAEYYILRSMRHKELTNQKTGRPFCAPLSHVAPVSCECHLDCHVLAPVSYQHIYCNYKA